jgi:hypothetical protein
VKAARVLLTARSRGVRLAVTVAGLGVLAWCGFALVASSAQACVCAAIPPFEPTVLPAAGSVAPRNTRIWVLHAAPVVNEQALRVELRDEGGAPIDVRGSELTVGRGRERRVIVLEPAELLPANAAFTIDVIGVADDALHRRVRFLTHEDVDSEPPELPSAEQVVYSPGAQSSCGPDSSLAVGLAADVWIVKRSAETSDAEAALLEPDAPSGWVAEMFADKTEGFDLVSSVCAGAEPAAKGDMQLGTFDLAGNFSGWTERVSFEPGGPRDATPCSVSGVAMERSALCSWALIAAAALGLAFRRARGLRGQRQKQ